MVNNKINSKQLTFNDITIQYNKLLEDARTLDYFVRDIDLQKDMVKRLHKFLQHMRSFKHQAKEKGDEKLANTFFHLQCVLNATVSALSVWISLKEANHQQAWDNLIDAQEYLSYALRIPEKAHGVEDFAERLKSIERIIFPGFPLYNSLGFIVKGGICSVCEKPLELCEHVEDEIYSGTVCKRIRVKDIEINHAALVPYPKDRRCIITEFEFSPNKMHDYMTLKYLRKKGKGGNESGSHMEGVLYNIKDLDLF